MGELCDGELYKLEGLPHHAMTIERQLQIDSK